MSWAKLSAARSRTLRLRGRGAPPGPGVRVDCNGEGVCVRPERITGLDLGPSSLPSPELERPDSLPKQGVPVSFKPCFWTACKRKSSPLLGLSKPRLGSCLLFEYF